MNEGIGAESQGMGLRDPEPMHENWVTARYGDRLIAHN